MGRVIGLGIVALLAAGCSGSPQAAQTTTVTVPSVVYRTVTSTATPEPPPGPANTITGDGTYLVGVDILPGTYRATPSAKCYWKRLSSLDGGDIIDNNLSAGPQVVEILSTDKAFSTERCGVWTMA